LDYSKLAGTSRRNEWLVRYVISSFYECFHLGQRSDLLGLTLEVYGDDEGEPGYHFG
jgi:hypothetical protein